MTANAHGEIKNPGVYRISGGARALFVVLLLVGLGAFGATLMSEPSRVWPALLMNHFFFLALALGGAFLATLQWLTGAMWSAPVRRLSESFTAFLPVSLITLVLVFFGSSTLYEWTHADVVVQDQVLSGKAGYLNTTFFVIRNVIAFGVWILFARKIIGNSIAQDWTKDYSFTVRNRKLAPVFIILFAITYTMHSFDVLMSLEPHWFSTIFGVYCFAGLFYSVLAATCLLAIHLRRKGALEGIVNANHLHDLGKFMFAFTIFWAYIGFSQFMLIWYANLPEETSYYLHRFHGGWAWVSVALLVGKFMVPFFVLLPRGAKRNERTLVFAGWWMLAFQFIDVMWMVQPHFFPEGPRFGLTEIGITLGFIGAFGLLVSRFLGRNNIVAIGDPRLQEAVFHHHQ